MINQKWLAIAYRYEHVVSSLNDISSVIHLIIVLHALYPNQTLQVAELPSLLALLPRMNT
jgi:hypothetical protein